MSAEPAGEPAGGGKSSKRARRLEEAIRRRRNRAASSPLSEVRALLLMSSSVKKGTSDNDELWRPHRPSSVTRSLVNANDDPSGVGRRSVARFWASAGVSSTAESSINDRCVALQEIPHSPSFLCVLSCRGVSVWLSHTHSLRRDTQHRGFLYGGRSELAERLYYALLDDRRRRLRGLLCHHPRMACAGAGADASPKMR